MNTKVIVSAISLATLLSACGGGGGSSPSTATPTNPTTPTTPTNPQPDANALQTSVATPTYGATTSALAAFNEINAARNSYGVGLLAQSSLLDTAASNHANYVSQRWSEGDFANTGHTEIAAKAGFTGTNPADRISYAKYAAASGTASETLTVFIEVDGVQSQPGATAVQIWLAGPYHRFAVLDGSRDVGIADVTARFNGEGGLNHAFVFNYGVVQGQQAQLPAKEWVGLWPVDKASNVNYAFGSESPDPMPERNGACSGYPVSVQVRNGITLSATSFTLIETTGGASVSAKLVTAATDANPSFARANSVYIMPLKPLKLGTQYTAHFVGSANGVAVDKTWSFTTTGQNQKKIFGCDPS